MHSLKVFMVTPYYPPSLGGMERFVLRLTENLIQRGIKVKVITGTHFGRVEQEDGLVTQLSTKFSVMGNPFIPQLGSELIKSDYDLVHAHDEHAFTSNIVAYTKGKVNRPFIMHCHGSFSGGSLPWRLFVYAYMKSLGSYTLSRSDINIALSPSEADVLARFKANRIRVIPNAVDPSELDRNADPTLFRSRTKIGQKKLVLFVGRLIKSKGVEYIPRIAKVINETRDDVFFAMVGDGPMRARVNTLIRKLGLKNLIVTGRIPGEELSSAYNAADAVLVPSQSEGMPAVVLEALLFRKPVVVTRLPTLTDYFERVCTFVEPGDILGYAKALKSVLEVPPTDKDFTDAEQLVLTRFNWKRVTDDIIETYRELRNFE
jgi:glycosyltransferase involved in cell wall biosynthesis